MSNKNQQQMNQAQRNRFASLPSRTNNIMKDKQEAEQVEQSQMQQTPIPQTIILESNRLTSRQDDSLAENYNTNHRWTTEYSNGGIQIRKGDEIRINSAYISSIGVGDLIEWDVREDSASQDNKANWIFSYYGCNDHLNDKRAGYNIREVQDSHGSIFGGNGKFNFDCDNSPCPLFRIQPTISVGTATSYGELTAQRLSWVQDPYLKCRFFGETFTIHNPVLDDHYEFILHPKLQLTDTGDHLGYATAIQVHKYTGNNVVGTIDPRTIMGVGQTLHFKSQAEPFITANPNTNFHDKNVNDWVFTIQDFRVAHLNSGISGANVIIVDSLNNLTGINFPQTEPITNTAKVLIGNLPSICSSSETFGNEYPHTALSTIVWTGSTADNYIEVGDKLKQYIFYGISFDTLDITQFNLTEAIIDSQTENEPMEVQVAHSTQTEALSKIKIHMISLKAPTGAGDRQKQQIIQFQFENGTAEDIAMKASGGGANALKVFCELIGTNSIVFDFYGSGSISGREIATCFLYTQSNNYSNFNYDTTTNIIEINNVRRNQNSETLLNVLSSGQPITFNTIINNSQDYYIIKTPNFFTDITATYIHENEQQFRGETWDWTLQTTINSNKRIGYLGYMKNNNNELTATNINVINNRALSHSQLQSNSFNFQNPVDNLMINKPMKYAGYFNNDLSHKEVKHYAQHELKIEENYSSPSDIATALTEQTHYVGKAINKNGVEVPNSESNGLIQNAYYIPVWSSAGDLTDTNATGDNLNVEDPTTGKLKGILQPNSFLLKYKMKNSSVAHYSRTDEPVYAGDSSVVGDYDIYFKTKNTYINKPIAFQDNSKGLLRTNGADDPASGHQFSLTADLDQTKTSALDPVNAGQVQGNLQFAKCFTSKSSAQNPVINGFPIEYAPDSFISQYVGSNNISISWDDTNSRFKIDFLHQPAVSKFEPSAEGIVQEGGQLSATIYYPAPVGKAGNLYKLPRTRVGGVNIENWTSKDFSSITTPQQVRTLCNLDSTINLSHNWFVCDHNNISPNTPQLQNNYDDIGNRFWNKLGFLNGEIYKTNVGSFYDPDTERYMVKGTTDNLVDIADALITAEEPAENTPFFFVNEKFDGSKTEPATNQFGSIGGLNFNSHLSGYGIPNTTGVPISFISNETLANLNIEIINGDDHGKRPAQTRPPFSEYLSIYNPDRERNTGYSFTTEPNSMVAGQLPIKTEFPYFYVMSDLIETDFNISANKGTGLNCLGVISKLNAEGDFFFQYQAPQSFFATKDKLISSITTELRTPTLGIPQALSPYSSVIYQISRYAPTPIKTSLPVWAEQKMVFDQMKDLLQNIATSLSPAIPIPADQQISDSMGGQVQGVIPDEPIQINPADQREIYQSMINSISGRITEPLPAVQEALPRLRNIQNPLQLTDDPVPELTEEQQLDYELAVSAIRGRTRPRTPPSNLIRPFPVGLGGLRHTNRFTLSQLVDNVPLNEIYGNTDPTETIAGSLGGESVDSLATIQPEPVRTRDKPDDDIPSMLGDSVPQSSVPPSYRGRSLPSYATGSIAPTYQTALTEVSEQTIQERVQEQRKEDDEMD